MKPRRNRARPTLEPLESRSLATTVIVLNGNAFSAAEPGRQTADAARRLSAHGHRAIEISYSTMDTPEAFHRLARRVLALSQGRPIGLVGFSAGGSLALRLAATPGLKVKAVLNFYGPPDLADWLTEHRGDRQYRYVVSHVGFTPGMVDILSGPADVPAPIINAFGRRDTGVVAEDSAASFRRDFSAGEVHIYDGPHGVGPGACRRAFRSFLSRIGPRASPPDPLGAA